MRYELERYELWARECVDEGVAAEHLGETCKEIRRLQELLQAWNSAYTRYLGLDRTADWMLGEVFDLSRAVLAGKARDDEVPR